MITPKDLSILLMLGDVLLFGILMNTQTFIWEKGRRNQLKFLSLISINNIRQLKSIIGKHVYNKEDEDGISLIIDPSPSCVK